MHRFRLAGGLFCAAILFLPGACAAAADKVAEIHVAQNGDDADQGTISQPLATIDAAAVGVEDEGGVHQIPLAVVHRSNLVPEFSEVSP